MTKAKKTAPKKKPGQPTKYNPVMQKKANEYLKQCGNEFWDYEKTISYNSVTRERKVNIKLPTVEGLAIYLGVHRDTLYEWAKHHPLISDTLGTISQMQKEMLLAGGLNGDYNPMIAKLVLAANHGMSDRTDVTSGDKPIQSNSIAFVTMKPDEADSK